MTRSPKDHRIPIMMSVEELGLLDEWRSNKRLWSRAEAIRRLIQRGLSEERQISLEPLKEMSTAAAQPVRPDVEEMPSDIAEAITEHRASRPYLPNDQEAMIYLIKLGLASLEGREELIELSAPDQSRSFAS